MIRQIFKQLWTERSHNGWLLLELTAVFLFLLLMNDYLWVRVKNYTDPLGYNTENIRLLKLKQLEPAAAAYTPPELIEASGAAQLQTLADRIRQYPDVESVSLSLYSAPYPRGGYWDALLQDTIEPLLNMQGRFVTPAYFDLMRIRSYDGQALQASTSDGLRDIVITEDAAEHFFGSAAAAIGQRIFRGEDYEKGLADSQPSRIVAVCSRFKNQEFEPYRPSFFILMSPAQMEEQFKDRGSLNADLMLRVRPGAEAHFEAQFMSEMGEQLQVDNLYVASLISSVTLRDNLLGATLGEIRLMTYVVLFVLITVFLGVFGAFWLRVHQRRGEIGIRMAMGAGRSVVSRCMVIEGLCLMAVAIPPAFVVYFNLLYAEVLDVWRLPFNASRVLIALSASTLILTLFILAGTLWPARRAASISPVEALREE